jgi:hypothetical protein
VKRIQHRLRKQAERIVPRAHHDDSVARLRLRREMRRGGLAPHNPG